jgi:Flp pilus assembly protein TadG
MLRRLGLLGRDKKGVSAVEFALIAPVFILLIVGIAQMGRLFYAHAGLRNAVAEGARFATIDPRPTAAQIIAQINANKATLDPTKFTTPTVTFTQDATSLDWFADIGMSYQITLDFIFYQYGPVTLSYSRRTWVQAPR